jgi:hypothetical protein
MSENVQQTTTVEEVDINIDAIFNGAPNADSIVTPIENTKKPNVFSKPENVDLSFLNEKSIENNFESNEKNNVSDEEVNEILNQGLDLVQQEDELETNSGKKRLNDMSKLFKDMIDEEQIMPFNDEKNLEDYSAKDWKELIKANLEERSNKVRRETPKQFFNSLPQELQVAAKYVADGGQDLKGLFNALAQVEEVRELSTESIEGQEHIVREYLQSTGYGTSDDIDEEIEMWKDLGKLEKQALKFKPKLDKMQEKIIIRKLEQQEQHRAQQQKASENYMSNVYNTLKEGKIGDITINKKTQSMLYNGLVNPAYPSISGNNTNLLGHLLEKYQFVEPNYDLVTEALWLLADPKSYKEQLMNKGTNIAVEQTVRQLKTAQSTKVATTNNINSEDKFKKQRTLPRNTNMFKRF